MIAMAMLSQQLADFNGEWEPKWGEGTGAKYCIYSRRSGSLLCPLYSASL
jgi:hypothetical protein